MATLAQVKEANPTWFDRGNRKFFNDKQYWVLHTRKHNPMLLRSTTAWTDMFGGKKRLHYRVNELDPETLKVGSLIDWEFKDRDSAKDFIKEYDDEPEEEEDEQ